ncbi:MAG: hypothetical protein RJA81_15 [Planctomycetota bacterium]|jgi:hypothetical protein
MIQTILEFFQQKRCYAILAGMSVGLASHSLAMAQSSYNPYEPYTSQFRNYTRPGGFNPFDAMSNNRSQNNTFESELDQLFGGRETATGRSRDTARYYNSFRKYDEDFDRLYRPNQDVDRLYNERKSSRESMYLKAFREKDPRKRAEMFRDFNRQEEKETLSEDKSSELSTDLRERSPRSTSSSSRLRNRISPETSTRNRTSRSYSPGRSESSRGGLLGETGQETRRSGSLVERSGLLSEEIRPSAPARGYGSLRSNDERKAEENRKPNPNQYLPGLPTLRP